MDQLWLVWPAAVAAGAWLLSANRDFRLQLQDWWLFAPLLTVSGLYAFLSWLPLLRQFWLALPLALLLATWVLWPYIMWQAVAGRPLEKMLERTSFQSISGEQLVPPPWKAPELALSVIIPAFNEAYRLPQMLDETFTYLEARAAASPNSGFSYEVIVVDDGSDDNTYAVALQSLRGRSLVGAGSGGGLRVLRFGGNTGKGFVTRAGMLVARGRLLLLADADGATRIGDLERLERALDPRRGGEGVHAVFGSRHHLREELMARRSPLTRFLVSAFPWLSWALVGGHLHDTQCGFKLFRADAARQIFASLHLTTWAFDVEVVLLAQLLGRRIAEVPVTWIDIPGSTFDEVLGTLSMMRDVVFMRALYALGVWRPSPVAR